MESKNFTAVKKDRSSVLMFRTSMPMIPPNLISSSLEVMELIVERVGASKESFDFIPLEQFGEVTGICELNYRVQIIDTIEDFDKIYGGGK